MILCRPWVDHGLFYGSKKTIVLQEKHKIMINIKTYFRPLAKSPNRGIVWIRFYVKGPKVHFSTKVECFKENWVEDDHYIRSSEPNARDKNLIIDNIISRINNVIVKFRLRDKTITKDSFLRAYNRPSDFATFFDFYSDYTKKNSRQIGKITFFMYKVLIDRLKGLNSDLSSNSILQKYIKTKMGNINPNVSHFLYISKSQSCIQRTIFISLTPASFHGLEMFKRPVALSNIIKRLSAIIRVPNC